jgi:aldehyde dehydrogenase (NAD+)
MGNVRAAWRPQTGVMDALDIRQDGRLFIGGRWVEPAGTGTIEVVSPHTEAVIAKVPEGTAADIDRAVAAARGAFDHGPWPQLDPAERAAAVARLAAAFGRRGDALAGVITAEMGCPITLSRLLQVGEARATWDYYAALGAGWAWEEERPGPVLVRHEPVGVVAAIVPWNGPQLVASGKLAPALVAGCTVVLKPDPRTPLDSYLLAEAVQEVQLPPGVVNIVAAGPECGEYLVAHPGVDKVAFTGSTAAGRRVGARCGQLLKRCTLELGGKSAAIVLDDADLPAVLPQLTMAALVNSDQTCVAQSRVLASRARYDQVVDGLAETAHAMPLGDPHDPATRLGPLVSRRQRERVEGYIELGLREGARLVTGGTGNPYERGWYVRPTVLADVGNDMRVAREEIFGPVVCVIPYDQETDAVRIAEDNAYGLAGSVWTADPGRGMRIARRIRTGTYGINTYRIEVTAPFGGRKASGVGRELGPEGLAAYLEPKSVVRAA